MTTSRLPVLGTTSRSGTHHADPQRAGRRPKPQAAIVPQIPPADGGGQSNHRQTIPPLILWPWTRPRRAFTFDHYRNLALALAASLSLSLLGNTQESVEYFALAPIASPQTAGLPFSVAISARNLAGEVLTGFNNTVRVAALVPGPQPQAVISEIDPHGERIEFTNPSPLPVEVSGWRVEVFAAKNWPLPSASFSLPPGTLMTSGGVFQVNAFGNAAGSYPVFYTLAPFYWGLNAQGDPLAVLLRDSHDEIVDFVCTVGTDPSQVLGTSAPKLWIGDPLPANSSSAKTYQRTGGENHRNAGDWKVAAPTLGAINPLLRLPFPQAIIEYPTDPAAVTLTNGEWTGLLSVGQSGSALTLRADDGHGHTGGSNPFGIQNGPPLTLRLPVSADQATPGFAGIGTVSIPQPAIMDLSVILESGDPAEILAPGRIVIPAGAKFAEFNVTNLDDGVLSGSQAVSITASAAGYTSATATITNLDNESTTLSVTLPPAARKGDGLLAGLGRVTMSGIAGKDVNVSLLSSDPELIQVPASVIIPTGADDVQFTLRAPDNGKLEGARIVAVTAAVTRWTSATGMIQVADNRAVNLVLSFVDPIVKDMGLVASGGSVAIEGTLETNLTVHLQSDLPGLLDAPESVVIPAGQTSSRFDLSLPVVAGPNGAQEITFHASAAGFVPTQEILLVYDHVVDHFTFVPLSGTQVINIPFPVAVFARDSQDYPVPTYSGSVPLSTTPGNSTSISPASAGPFTNGVWAGTVVLSGPSTGTNLRAGNDNGPFGISNPFNVVPNPVRKLEIVTGDIVSNPNDRFIYASGASTSPAYSNAIVRVDAIAGVVDSVIPVGSDPDKLALSEDGRHLYVGLNGESAVRLVNLTDGTSEQTISLSSGDVASQIEVMPGNPDVVAILSNPGIALYDHGHKLTNQLLASMWGPFGVFQFGSSSNLYTYNNETTEFSFIRSRVSSEGVVYEDLLGSLISGFVGFHAAGGLIYAANGQVANPTIPSMIGFFPIPDFNSIFSYRPLVLPDLGNNRVFFIVQSGADFELRAYEADSFALAGRVAIQALNGVPTNLRRWGTNGLAFRSTGGQIVLIQTDLLPSPAAADLSINQAVSSMDLTVGGVVTYTLTATNQGPADAHGVVVQTSLPDALRVRSVNSPSGTHWIAGGSVVCSLGTLTNSQSISIAITIDLMRAGTITNSAVVFGEEADPRSANNSSLLPSVVAQAPGANSITLISIPAQDMVWDAERGLIYASVSSEGGDFANRLVALDPSTGSVLNSFPLGSAPGRLALSDDSQFLYAAVDGGARVKRLNLATGQYDALLDLGPGLYVEDMVVVNGAHRTLAISRMVADRSPGHAGVVIFDDSTPRPRTALAGTLLAPGEDQAHLYAFNNEIGPGSYYRIALGSEGITAVEPLISPFMDFEPEIRLQAGYLYSAYGEVALERTATRVGTFPGVPPSPLDIALHEAALYLVAPDTANNRIFYLIQNGTTAVLHAFKRSTFEEVGSFEVPGIDGTSGSLIRWGTNGLAFLTTGRQLFVLRTALVPTDTAAALAVLQTVSTERPLIGRDVTYTITVTNAGPATATGVVLTDVIPPGGSLVSTALAQGFSTVSNGVLTCNLGSLSQGQSTLLTIVVAISGSGDIVNTASVAANEPNPNPLQGFNALSASSAFIRTVDLAAADLAYDTTKNRLYASVSPSDSHFGNSIVYLDSPTDTPHLLVSLSASPGKLALSDNGQYLYAALSTGAVARIDTTDSSVFSFSLGEDPQGFPLFVGYLAALPGQPNALAISRNLEMPGGWRYYAGIAIYDDGVMRPEVTPAGQYQPFCPIAFYSPSILYAALPLSLGKISVTATGADLISTTSGLAPGFDCEFRIDGNFAYFFTGSLVNLNQLSLAGSFAASGPLFPDPLADEVYFVAQEPVGFSRVTRLKASDKNSLSESWSAEIPGVQGSVLGIAGGGQGKLAFLTDSNQVFMIDTAAVSPQPKADLTISASVSQNLVLGDGSVTYTYSITNLGPWTASNVLFTNLLPEGVSLVSAAASLGAITDTNGQVVCALGAMTNRASAVVTLTMSPHPLGILNNVATVTSEAIDPNPSNNSAMTVVDVVPPPTISVDDVTLIKPHSGLGAARFTLRLSSAIQDSVQVHFATSDGTALADVDYKAKSGVVTFAKGATNVVVTVSILGSTLPGPTTIFSLTLSDPVNGSLGRNVATGTLLNSATRLISALGTNVTVESGDSTDVQFAITLVPPSSQLVSVRYRTSDGSALAGQDYVPKSGSLSFAPGEAHLSVPVRVRGNPASGSRGFYLVLEDALNANLSSNEALVTIVTEATQPPILISSVTYLANVIHIQFPTTTGRTYQLERVGALGVGAWSGVRGTVIGTGAIMEISDEIDASTSHLFYRIRLVQ